MQKILISQTQIACRIRELSRAIERDFAGRELVVVAVLNGTVLFLADLIRHLSLPLRLDFIGVSSYRLAGDSGALVFTKELRLDVRGRDVLLVADILKLARRVEKVQADYVGFSIPDLFVVGYGLDFAERYRNLPFIGVLRPELYRAPNEDG